MKKLLYIAPFFHIPPTDGASQRAVNLLLQLRKEYQITLLTYRDQDDDVLENWARQYSVFINWIPGGYSPVKQNFLHRIVSFTPPGFANYNSHAISEAVNRQWELEGSFDILYFATQIIGQAALERCWPARQILDLYDIYTPIEKIKPQQVSIWRPYHWLYWLEARRVENYEKRIFVCFDQLLVVSDQESQHVKKLAPMVPVSIISNGVILPTAFTEKRRQPCLLIVGSFRYGPNVKGLLWFYEHVWPIVRAAYPKTKLWVVGRGEETIRRHLPEDPNLSLEGKVTDLASYYQQAACAIVPILSGGGSRLKLLEGMAWGLPVVSTHKGAEGIDHKGTILEFDSPEQFALAVIRCLSGDPKVWRMAQEARKLVSENFTWEKIGYKLLDVLRTNP